MDRRTGRAPIVAAVALALALAGCNTAGLFARYDVPESPEVEAAPWPQLVDVPEAPPVGEYTENVPDPLQAARTQTALSVVAAGATARAAALSQPVIGEAERARMLARARRTR